MQRILLTTDYSSFIPYTQAEHGCKEYINHIKREQHFLKHLIYKLLHDTNYQQGLDTRVLVYIHAGFGERTEANYGFYKGDSYEYASLIATDDWNDIGDLDTYIDFFYNYIP